MLKFSVKKNYIFALLILLVGFGGLLGYDLYVKPYVLAQKVVKVKAPANSYLPKNYVLTSKDVYLDSVQSKDVPANAIRDLTEIESKILNVSVSDGVILTETLVDVNDLEPKEGEGIFPIRKEDIYAINGSLRARDKVDLYLVYPEEQRKKQQAQSVVTGVEQDQVENEAVEKKSFLSDISVNYVRTDDNNDVRDTEDGKTTNRVTSTGKVSTPELLLSVEQGLELKGYLELGYKLWIVRIN
ncbi:hypothetical protein [Paenibacillus ihuae]|uniref:hypothetical protein n=1 Tax=Paenibacillus ihuae TaxID=1232431 RepID=UPI0006D54EFF|nr:hypothetical protein [Paenibacillus ihuae]